MPADISTSAETRLPPPTPRRGLSNTNVRKVKVVKVLHEDRLTNCPSLTPARDRRAQSLGATEPCCRPGTRPGRVRCQLRYTDTNILSSAAPMRQTASNSRGRKHRGGASPRGRWTDALRCWGQLWGQPAMLQSAWAIGYSVFQLVLESLKRHQLSKVLQVIDLQDLLLCAESFCDLPPCASVHRAATLCAENDCHSFGVTPLRRTRDGSAATQHSE